MKIPPYIEILRPKQWFKNVVVLFGSLSAIGYVSISTDPSMVLLKGAVVTILACLISSVNYSINDITDEMGDSKHPVKKSRVIPNKRVSKHVLIVIIIVLLFGSLTASFFFLQEKVTLCLFALFVAGIFYNIKPVRLKDLPVLDVIAESINNPIRILIGWFAVTNTSVFPPLSLLLLFWTSGAALMSAKRYAELNFFLKDHKKMSPQLYRSSFETYTPQNIMVMVLLYVCATITLFILFSLEFKRNLLFALPFVIMFFAWFLRITVEQDSFFREPERVFFKKPLFAMVGVSIFIFLTALALT